MIISTPARAGTNLPARRIWFINEDLAKATATAAVPTRRPMPNAYAMNNAIPSNTDEALKLATTSARNGAMLQVSEATAYAAPNATTETRRRLILGPRGLKPKVGSGRPASSQIPPATSAKPTATVTHG